MKVLHVIPGVAPRYGGPSRAIIGMSRALQERGVEPLVATTDADGAGRLPVELGVALPYQGVPAIFFPRQWSEAFKYSRPLARWLEENVEAFDVVHIHAVFSHASLAAARASRRKGVPYIVRPLGSLDPWSLRQRRLLKFLLWHLGVKRMLLGAAALHYTTEQERTLAAPRTGWDRGIVVPLGIDEEVLSPSATDGSLRQRYPSLGDDPYVLVLSRLHPKKGLEHFLKVFLDVTDKEELKQWRLVIAGEGEAAYVQSLKRLAQRLGGQRVLFTGWLEGTEKVAALREAALLALPSHQENFGLAVVEALACSVPVLISQQVNLSEEVRAAGVGWVSELDREALSLTLAQALLDEAERARRGRGGRELVRRRFRWPAVAAELAGLYGSIAEDAAVKARSRHVIA